MANLNPPCPTLWRKIELNSKMKERRDVTYLTCDCHERVISRVAPPLGLWASVDERPYPKLLIPLSRPSYYTMGIKGLTALLSEHAPKAITVSNTQRVLS